EFLFFIFAEAREGDIKKLFRDVAQPGSALRSGRRGRWFESSHPDKKSNQNLSILVNFIDLQGFFLSNQIISKPIPSCFRLVLQLLLFYLNQFVNNHLYKLVSCRPLLY